MNRDDMLVRAISVLQETGIVKINEKTKKLCIEKAFRGRFHPLVRLWKWEVFYLQWHFSRPKADRQLTEPS